jgi:beta-1,4-N-acetylglucosaminyltransferase
MEALRYECPLIIVPNPTLLDNHQRELALECARKETAVVGKLGRLHEALSLAGQLAAKRNLEALPPYREPPFPVPETERRTLLDWALLTCYPEEYERQLGQHSPPAAPRRESVVARSDSLDDYDRNFAVERMRSG